MSYDIQAAINQHLDEGGDLAPPWARFPDYERYTIGWRMGFGESWLMMWWAFLERFQGFDERLAYLRRHPKAPYSWADTVYHLLYPAPEGDQEFEDDEEEDEAQAIKTCLSMGLVDSDIAYRIWLARQDGMEWPWDYQDNPIGAARYQTRDLWFWSRQWRAARDKGEVLPSLDGEWTGLAQALQGTVEDLDLDQGLLSLVKMLCAGEVRAPWLLGLTPKDDEDNFELDMGYVDAFRLWLMSAFDDRPHLDRYLASQGGLLESWVGWLEENVFL